MRSPKRANPFSNGSSTSSNSGSIAPTSKLEFVNEQFEVKPVLAPAPAANEAAPGSQAAASPGVAYSPDYTEEDLFFLTQSVWSLPSLWFDKLPERDPDKLKKWNHEFYRYCIKKKINPWDYFFDELPIMISTLGLAGGMYRDYREAYGKNDKEVKKEEKRLAGDYEHEKQLAEEKERAIKEGKIKTEGMPAAPGGQNDSF